MYRINPLMRGVLITTDEVIFHAPTKQTLDPRTIQNCIIIAEERFIVPALGYGFYYDMVSAKNIVVTTDNKATLQAKFPMQQNNQPVVTLREGMIVNAYEQMNSDYQDLWIQQLWKLLAECVMVIAYPEAFIQFGTEGVVHNVPQASPMKTEGIVTPALASVKWVMDKKIMDRIDPLLIALKNYICWKRQSSLAIYPLYTIECPCDNDNTKQSRKTGFVLGLYDDNDDDCNCVSPNTPRPPWYD